MGYKKFYPVDKNDPRVWANQIKILMEERGITQQKLASESGVPSTTIPAEQAAICLSIATPRRSL